MTEMLQRNKNSLFGYLNSELRSNSQIPIERTDTKKKMERYKNNRNAGTRLIKDTGVVPIYFYFRLEFCIIVISELVIVKKVQLRTFICHC